MSFIIHHPSRFLVLHVRFGTNPRPMYCLSQFYICNKIIKLTKTFAKKIIKLTEVTKSFVCYVTRALLTTDLVLPRTAESLDGFRGMTVI